VWIQSKNSCHQENREEKNMTNNTNSKNFLQIITSAPQKVMNFLSGAVAKVFSPSEDNYPETGTQPFEGEPADKKHY
jgi:hypothetical protein